MTTKYDLPVAIQPAAVIAQLIYHAHGLCLAVGAGGRRATLEHARRCAGQPFPSNMSVRLSAVRRVQCVSLATNGRRRLAGNAVLHDTDAVNSPGACAALFSHLNGFLTEAGPVARLSVGRPAARLTRSRAHQALSRPSSPAVGGRSERDTAPSPTAPPSRS